MDTNDVSGVESYRAFLNQLKGNAKRASLRKGEIPTDHPPPNLLVTQFMFKLACMSEIASGNKHGISTSQVPPSYPPCVRPTQELKPLMISRMTLEYHHRGNRALVHVLTPPDRMTAVMAIVEDEEGTATLLQLYNQPEESRVSKGHILQKGNVCIIKEPFFKATTDGSYSLRVDHPSDIIWLEQTDDRIPLMWRQRVLCLDESSQDIRKQGNTAVQKQNWAEAESLYTKAIRIATTPEESQLAHLNRSLVNLRLHRPQKALDDASKAILGENPPAEKALFREAKAYYSLGNFKQCMEKMLAVVRCNSRNTDAWAEIERIKQRLHEEETGSYQFDSLYKQAKATPPLVDCATYIGPVAVRDSAGRGKGLFTTRHVKAGELLFCEKAFAYAYGGIDSSIGLSNTTILMDLSNDKITMGGQAHLITQIIQKIYHNPAGAEVFTELYHGGYAAVMTPEVDGAPVVDTFLAVKIIQLNCFGAPRCSFDSINSARKDIDNEMSAVPTAHNTCGVWPLASRINHSCVTNCRRSFIGDMMIVRASQDMDVDTELFFGYATPLPHQTYEETQKNLQSWGFVCHCGLCLEKKSTSRNIINQRKALRGRFKGVFSPGASKVQLDRARKILENLGATYKASENVPLVPRLELWDPYFALGVELLRTKLSDGLEMLLRALEALGFIIVASPPRDIVGGKNQKEAKLEIKQWGQSNDFVACAFMHMMHAYERLAPELCPVAKEYARVAYSIFYGETETISTLDWQLS